MYFITTTRKRSVKPLDEDERRRGGREGIIRKDGACARMSWHLTIAAFVVCILIFLLRIIQLVRAARIAATRAHLPADFALVLGGSRVRERAAADELKVCSIIIR